jgi:hypothetical protein
MEQRRTRRFKLELPLSVTRTGAERIVLPGTTRNISSNGVLFTTAAEPDLGVGSIEYVITLTCEGPHTIRLRCIGKVIRLEPDDQGCSDASYQVAATLERYEFVRAGAENAAAERASSAVV